MRIHRVNSKTKTVSSYLLSGINIKKMIADQSEIAQDVSNISDATIIKINKRPIFKIIKEKQQQTTELPNKTFKIRSFTRKLKGNAEEIIVQENNEMFQKVQKLRHLKSVNNRIQLFNLSAISKLQKKEMKDNQKTELSQKEYKKMRQILVNNTEKWRASSQIIVKQLIQRPLSTKKLRYNNPTFQYTQLNTQKYCELASKITYKINNQFKQTQQQSILLIIVLDILQINQKKIVKSSKIIAEDQTKLQKYRGKFGPQTFQLIKLFTNKQHPITATNPNVKIAFKVNNAQELEQVHQKLYLHEIDDYYCIFYINKKYSEILNLYQLSPLLKNAKEFILIENKHRLSNQFPVVHNVNCILFATYNQTLFTLKKLSLAIKSFLLSESPLEDKQISIQRDQNRLVFSNANESEQEYQIKYEDILINTSQLEARLKFTLQSRNIKNRMLFKNHKQQRSQRRSVLEDKTHSINNISQSMSLQNDSEKKSNQIAKTTLDVLQQKLLSSIQTRKQDNLFRIVTTKSGSNNHKNQQIDDITNNIKHGTIKSKPLNVEVGDLVRRNEHIFKQISSYLQKTNMLDHRFLNSKERHFSSIENCLQSLRCIKIM